MSNISDVMMETADFANTEFIMLPMPKLLTILLLFFCNYYYFFESHLNTYFYFRALHKSPNYISLHTPVSSNWVELYATIVRGCVLRMYTTTVIKYWPGTTLLLKNLLSIEALKSSMVVFISVSALFDHRYRKSFLWAKCPCASFNTARNTMVESRTTGPDEEISKV